MLNAIALLAQDVDGWLQGAPLFPGFASMPGIYEPTRIIAFSMLVHAYVLTRGCDGLSHLSSAQTCS